MEGKSENHVERMEREANFTVKAIEKGQELARSNSNLLRVSLNAITRAQNAIAAVPANLRGPKFDRETVILEVVRAFGDSLSVDKGITVTKRDEYVQYFEAALRERLAQG